MSEAQPPTEFLPIFNPANYPDDSRNGIGGGGGAGSYVNFPTAQGTETFPAGVVWGDGSYQNSADTPLEDNTQVIQYTQPYWAYWPTPNGGTGFVLKNSQGAQALSAWYLCYAASALSYGAAGGDVTIGYYVDMYQPYDAVAGYYCPTKNPYLMVSVYPRANQYMSPSSTPGSISYQASNVDPELTCFTPYNSKGFFQIDCSSDGKYVGVLPYQNPYSAGLANYPLGVIAQINMTNANQGTIIQDATISLPANETYIPQTIQISATGKFITVCQMQINFQTGNPGNPPYPLYPIVLYQSKDYGATYDLIKTFENNLGVLTFYTPTNPAPTGAQANRANPPYPAPNLGIQAPHAQSKNGRILCVAYCNTVNLASYSDGMKVAVSNDFGRTWTEQVALPVLTTDLTTSNPLTYPEWYVPTSIAMSSTGQMIYISTCIDNGKDQVTAPNVNKGTLIYSNDYGVTWQHTKYVPIPTSYPYTFLNIYENLGFVRCTASGQGFIAAPSTTSAGPNYAYYNGTQGGAVCMQTLTGSPPFASSAIYNWFNMFMDGSTGQSILGINYEDGTGGDAGFIDLNQFT